MTLLSRCSRRFSIMQPGRLGVSLATTFMVGLGVSLSVYADELSNFGNFHLNPKTRGAMVDGAIGGATSLSAVTANYDRDNNPCFGFGTAKPDHILELKQTANRLQIVVDSRGRDTTIVVQAPNGAFFCGDDFGNSKDAGIEGEAWNPGQYKIWVGSVTPNLRSKYRLKVQVF